MRKLILAALLLPSLLAGQQLRQMTRSTAATTLGDSSLIEVSDTLTSKITFVTKATSFDQVRKILSKFAFDSVKSTGVLRALGTSVFTGAMTINGTATFNAQPIMSGLTASLPVFTDGSKGLVSNTVTGSGNVVMSASPTLTGTLTAATATFSGVVTHSSTTTLSAALTYGGVTLSNAVTGTGNMVLSASPTLTGTALTSAITASGVVTGAGFISSAGNSMTWKNAASDANVTISNTGGAGVATMTLSAANGFVFNAGLSGITTLAGTGAISGFTSITTGNVIATAGLAANAASRSVLTHGGSQGILYTHGADVSTNGTFDIVSVRSNGTTSTTMLSLSTTGAVFGGTLSGTGTITPGTDNASDLGSSSKRWVELYINPAASGVGDTYICLSTAQQVHQGATCAASTRKMKENILPFTDRSILNLRPVSFNFQRGYYNSRKEIGLIVEEAALVDPRFAFFSDHDDKLSNGQIIRKGDPAALNLSSILAALVAEVQAQKREIDDLKRRIP